MGADVGCHYFSPHEPTFLTSGITFPADDSPSLLPEPTAAELITPPASESTDD
ncbi:MAG: hypothetical protein EBS83_04795 [Planctomycetia bacterium]|nr:hypothetical protein [Planctomycetia bacterium]